MLNAGRDGIDPHQRRHQTTMATTHATSRARCSTGKARAAASPWRCAARHPPWPVRRPGQTPSAPRRACRDRRVPVPAPAPSCTDRGKQQHRVQHHVRRRHGVAAKSQAMPRDHVDPAVAEAVLLNEIRHQPAAPVMSAAGLATESESVAVLGQSIAHVVVVAITQLLVEEPDCVERGRSGTATFPVQTWSV